MLEEGYFKGQRSNINQKCNFLLVGAINMHLLSGHYVMHRQVYLFYFIWLLLLAFM